MVNQTPSWLRAEPKISLWARVRHSLAVISWFSLSAAVFWLAGLGAAVAGFVLEDWYSLALAALLEVCALVGLLFAAREDL